MTTSSFDPLSTALAASPSALPVVVILLKITCVLLIALAATVAMQRTAASTRHLVWLISLAALLLLPALAIWSPLPIRVLPVSLAPVTLPATEHLAAPAGVTAADGRARITNGAATVDQATSAHDDASLAPAAWSLGSVLLLVWGVVAFGLTARLAYGAWSVRRIVRRGRPLEDPSWQAPLYEIADRLGLEAAPVLLRSEDVKMPFAAGLVAATIVLPAESDAWSAERRSAVLIHELGHVRRRDLIGHTLSRVACALYWFHPLVWTAARRLRAESERACDDLALVFGARPSDYAEHLLDIVTCVRDHNTPAVALAMAHRREFEGRMLAILNPELERRGANRLETASLVGSLALLAIFVGAAAPVRRLPETPVPRAPEATGLMMQIQDSLPQQVVAPVPPHSEHPAATPMPPARPEPRPDPQPNAESKLALSVATQVMTTGPQQSDDERAAVLAKTLRTDPSAGVRRVAAWGLNRYAQLDVAQEALVYAVGSDADATVREMAAWALAGARHSAAASAVIVRAIEKDRDAGVRATAVWAAGSIGDASAVPALIGALKDADPDIREMAAWSIGVCRPEEAPAPLVSALADKEKDVRLSVAWALFRIRDPETTTAIDAAFRHETDADVREGLIRALGQMGDRSVDALQRLLSSPDSAVRTVAVAALAGGEAGGPWPWPRPQPRPFP